MCGGTESVTKQCKLDRFGRSCGCNQAIAVFFVDDINNGRIKLQEEELLFVCDAVRVPDPVLSL
jgi:hypothetical protein